MKSISTLIMLLGHATLASLHSYIITLNGGFDSFQIFSFAVVHGLWYNFYTKVIKERIYGSR
jgi:hypothetical protein